MSDVPDALSGGAEPPDLAQRAPELARAVVDAAKVRPRPRRRAARPSKPATGGGDPQQFGAVLAKLLKDRGWQQPAAEATVFGRWERLVGPEVAEHSRPVRLAGTELTIEADSTAWATQLRLLAGSLLKQIAAEVGHGVVKSLRIHGPAAPSWRRGPLRAPGPGPRDTYG